MDRQRNKALMATKKNYKDELINELNKLEETASLSDIQKTTSNFLGTSTWVSIVGRKVFVGTVMLAIISLILICTTKSKVFDIIVYGAWTILPPAWFMYEYAWEFPDELRFDADQISDLKYKHELAGKIWGGLVLLISAIVYLKYKVKIF